MCNLHFKQIATLLAVALFIQPLAAQHSIAREWNEALLKTMQEDLSRPHVQARNIFQFSVALYDAWAAYDDEAETYMLGKNINGYSCPCKALPKPQDVEAARREAMSFAAYRFLLTTPHRVQATIISDNGTIEMTRQMQSASRVQISMDSDDFDSEIIIVDGEMWQKMNDMDWQKMPVASEMLADLTGVSEETLTWIKDVQFTGVELLDGTPCFVYTYGLEIDETDQASNMQNKLWINAVSGLPVQLESQGTAAGMTSQTVQRITPDPSIEVVAPVP